MPIHLFSLALDKYSTSTLVLGAATGVAAYGIKVLAGGRKSAWEREWAGKLIMVVAPPTPTTLALLHHLLHLPSPPQVLYLPPLASPLPTSLVTLIHTLKLGASNPQAQLHCEPLPPTVAGVRDFVRKWGAAPRGTTGEEGRRVDAIVLGGGWECYPSPSSPSDAEREALLASLIKDIKENEAGSREGGAGDGTGAGTGKGVADKKWSQHQYHFHLITSLLPSLLKAPAERDIRIINLVSPAYPAAIPRLEKQLAAGPDEPSDPSSLTKRPKTEAAGMLERAGADGLTTFFLQSHFRLILDALATAAQQAKGSAVPDPTKPVPQDASQAKTVDVTSNIKTLTVVMPWSRDEVLRPLVASRFGIWLWILLYPIWLLITPGPGMAIQSVLYALSAPVLYDNEAEKGRGAKGGGEGEVDGQTVNLDAQGEAKTADGENTGGKAGQAAKKAKDELEKSRAGVRQGDVVRDCSTITLPPVLYDRTIARGTYDRIEKEVEDGVREYEAAVKTAAEAAPKRDTKVKFAEAAE